jgi:anti-sigma factor RsiW
VRCDDVAPLLAGVTDGSALLDRRASRHVGSCLRCQAELAQYRRLTRSLRQLRDEPVPMPPDLPTAVIAYVAEAGDERSGVWTRRVAYAGALAATAAGAAGAIALVASRSRRVRLAAAS